MTTEEIISLCDEKIASPTARGMVQIMIPGHAGRANSKRFPCLSIKGEIVCEFENECLCVFDAKELKKAIERRLKSKAGQAENTAPYPTTTQEKTILRSYEVKK